MGPASSVPNKPPSPQCGFTHSFLVTGYLTRDTRNVTGYFSGISSVTGYSVTGYFSGNGEIMGIALRPPVGEILAISRSKSIENPLHFVNSECIWSSRIVKKNPPAAG